MPDNKQYGLRRCVYCGADFAPVQPSQRFCSGTNHRYLHHARIRPRGRRRDAVRVSDEVYFEVVHLGGAAAPAS